MKNVIFIWILVFIMSACDTKQTVIDTGVSSPYFDGTIMDYLRSDVENWGYTVEMIERAELVDLFEGQVDSLPQITFLAPPSFSIFRFIMDSQYEDRSNGVYKSVHDVPVEKCRDFILKHVIKGKHLKSEIGFRNMDYYINAPEQTGGTDFTCLGGNVVRAYLQHTEYQGVPDAGAIVMYLYSISVEKDIPVATPDIQPRNGVVHALNYGYQFGRI